jgi:excisionase family DNA binding protein
MSLGSTQPSDSQSNAQMLLTVSEACDRLRISRWMLYRLIQRRQLETIKIGSRRLVPVAGITALVEQLVAESD